MKLVIFGLSISSSWGNGHATLWRGLCRALGRRGHRVVFFERDVPYYAQHRDLDRLTDGQLHLYSDWQEVRNDARREISDADAVIITSYCPDALAAERILQETDAARVFYDLDTGVTLTRIERGEAVDYIGPHGLRDYDLVLSYVGGRALEDLKTALGAQATAPLYGSVDPEVHSPVEPLDRFRADLSYLGTYAPDRQPAFDRLFLEPARRLPAMTFRVGGAQYPHGAEWAPNVWFNWHVPPADHAAFYCSSRMTLNLTREAMARNGYCPSGRLFEAAACGVPILTDAWEGLDLFLEPGREVVVVESTQAAMQALELSDSELRRIADAARERVLAEHTAEARALELEGLLAAIPVTVAVPGR